MLKAVKDVLHAVIVVLKWTMLMFIRIIIDGRNHLGLGWIGIMGIITLCRDTMQKVTLIKYYNEMPCWNFSLVYN